MKLEILLLIKNSTGLPGPNIQFDWLKFEEKKLSQNSLTRWDCDIVGIFIR